ncbi:MAG: hypothetical protein IKF71_04450 [Bacilli bacterium]|nr:hypothetical protein [Bacilli bacterium]
MNELIEKVDNLKKELDSSPLITSVMEALEMTKKDKELSKLLKEYEENPKEELKEKILENKTFQTFKIKETELNLFIMELNQKLKMISKKGTCSK